MGGGLQLRTGCTGEFADSCIGKIGTAATKMDFLEMVAELASPRIDEFRRMVLEDPDEISLNFIDLLDQIVFELAENISADNAVREYIIEDLHARLTVFLDIFQGRETYVARLNKRYITHEDTIIMRHCGMKEFAPLLMTEFYEQPALQRSILRTLLTFDGDDLLNFYYGVAKEAEGAEVRALSLVGLKKVGPKFRYWRQLTTDDEGYRGMIAYAEAFDPGSLEKNNVPGDLYSFIFVLCHIVSVITMIDSPSGLGWALTALHSLLHIGYYNSSLSAIYPALCEILVFARTAALNEALHDDTRVKELLELIDFLPREFFERITPKLSLLGETFIRRVNGLVGAGKVKLDERESNSLSFIYWKTGSNL
jgi:hypothetical protein